MNAVVGGPAMPGGASDACAVYVALGLHPIRIRQGSKLPVSKAWQNSAPKFDDFGPNDNIGIILGPPSNGVVDIDLDCEEARVVAAMTLGHLPAFGRASIRPPGHRLVRATDLPSDGAKRHALKIGSEAVVMEIRAGIRAHPQQ